ncbi:MAG TPA: SAM-dependent methyltransferase, partial [Streptosporangiaceae bacterium]
SHAHALMTGNCDYVDADLRDVPRILAGAHSLDFSRPVAVLMLAVLQFIPDSDDPPGVVAALARAMAPGSYVAISHMTAEFDPDVVGPAVHTYNASVTVPIHPRNRDQVAGLLGGLELIDPGVVQIERWRPDIPLDLAGLPPEVTYLHRDRHRAGLRADLYAAAARVR